jgi:NAD+ synthase (glutamine-hydrolysing)
MKIAIAQLNFHVGNFEFNLEKIVSRIREAREHGADLVVFSELSITGYPPRDFLDYPGFIEKCRKSLEKILPETRDIDCILGLPWENLQKPGKALYNAALHLSEGKIRQVVHKALLPTYDIFDEYRYFEPGNDFHCIQVKGHTLALTICEDIWNIENRQYKINPMDFLIRENPELMINIAASPFFYGQREARWEVLRANIEAYKIPLLYVNHVGAQTELIFDGGSLALNAQGGLMSPDLYFKEALVIIQFPGEVFPVDLSSEDFLLSRKDKKWSLKTWSNFVFENPVYLERIHQALLLGIRDFFKKSKFQKAVIGLSGGIDSALVAVLAAEALGPENILAVLMPSQYSSDHSISDAQDLVNRLGIKSIEIPIESLTRTFDSALQPLFQGLPFSLAEENIQSRTRGVLLMAISNKLGHILLNTSNKSECAVGYGTLYGDMCGALSVLGDLYKTQVYSLSRFLNREMERIPRAILEKAPSAELRPNQKDSDSLPEYADLDPILLGYIEESMDFEALVQEGFPAERVERTLGMVNRAEFKRYQSPPILRVSSRAFGMGRRMPIVGKYDQ